MIYKDKGLIYSEYVLDFLNRSDISYDNKLSIKAETFYNCREQGYVFNIHNKNYSDKLYVWVYAHRNSDEPTIVWGKDIEFNNMFTEDDWNKHQKTYANIENAVIYVEKIIKENIKECE